MDGREDREERGRKMKDGQAREIITTTPNERPSDDVRWMTEVNFCEGPQGVMDEVGGPLVIFEPVGYADCSYRGLLLLPTGLCIIYTVLLVLGTGGPWDELHR